MASRWLSFALSAVLLATGTAWSQALEVDPLAGPQRSVLPSEDPPFPLENPYVSSSTRSGSSAPSGSSGVKPFEVTVTESRYLPPEMYGQWNVTARLIRTDVPGGLPSVVNDIWVLENSGNTVSISNPASGAHASISVDEVVGNSATFHHKVEISNRRLPFGLPHTRQVLIEQPTVSVDGDVMTGITTHRYFMLRDGEVDKLYTAVFKLHAERLSGGRIQLGRDPNDLNFEIEDIQIQPEEIQSPETVDSTMYVH